MIKSDQLLVRARWQQVATGGNRWQHSVGLKRSCIKVKTDDNSFRSICPGQSAGPVSNWYNSRGNIPGLSTPPMIWKKTEKAATKSRSYLMSSSVANHEIGIKKTGQDLVHWQVLLLFKRVWHVCTILRNKCKAMQYSSTHSKSTIPKSPEIKNNRSHGGLTVSHDLSPESVNIFLQLSDGGGCDACRRTVRHCCNHVLRSIDPSPVWQADRLAATCIKQKVGAPCSSHQKHSIKN